MFKTPLLLLLICSMYLTTTAQTTSIDALALKIPQANTYSATDISNYIKQNFSTDTARVRAIYVWIANNISYDLPRFHARDKVPAPPPQTVADVLKTRSAVCQGYADLFAELCNNIGIRSVVVSGYTKKGGVVSPVGHAWTAAELEGKWYVFDPTWGAGYVRDDKYVKSFNNNFYKLSPADMIKDHMPFDPMYQFLDHPVTNKEFIDGQTTVSTGKQVFNYVDTLSQYNSLSPAEKLASELRRVERNGVRNDLILSRVNYLKTGIQSYASKDSFTEGGEAFKAATTLFNEYINHKNKQFTTVEDKLLKQMIDSMNHYVKLSRSLLNAAVPRTDAQRQAMTNNNSNIERFSVQLLQEKTFVEKYLATDVNSRKQLFIRR